MSKLRQSARGQECTIRIPGVCNRNPETVVLAHVGRSHMAGKCPDIHAAFCCSDCHDVIDGRVCVELSANLLSVWKYEGMMRTQLFWLNKGLISEN